MSSAGLNELKQVCQGSFCAWAQPIQWETMLQSSHWLSPYPEWSLYGHIWRMCNWTSPILQLNSLWPWYKISNHRSMLITRLQLLQYVSNGVTAILCWTIKIMVINGLGTCFCPIGIILLTTPMKTYQWLPQKASKLIFHTKRILVIQNFLKSYIFCPGHNKLINKKKKQCYNVTPCSPSIVF